MANYTLPAASASLQSPRSSAKSRHTRKALHSAADSLASEQQSPLAGRYAGCFQPASPSQVSRAGSRGSINSPRGSTHSVCRFTSESTTSSDSECGFSTPDAKSPRHSASQQSGCRTKVTVTLDSANSFAGIKGLGKSDLRSVVQQVERPKPSENAYCEHMFTTFQALKFVHSLKPVDPVQLAQKTVWLPPTSRKTVVFDLDETLVHCVQDPSQAQVALGIPMPSGETITVGVNIRPYARECLSAVSRFCEVIVFTASQQVYADQVLDILDPSRTMVQYRLYRDHCVMTDGMYIKDLRILGNRRLQDVTIIDNAAYSFGYQLDNGIPIISWYDDASDRELYNLVAYLQRTASLEDVRAAHRDTFRLHSFYEEYLRAFIRPSINYPSRPSIRWKSRTRGSELPTNYQSLATISAQLKKATEDFERVNKTKEVLAASNSIIRKKISRAISDSQALKKNHEKLHNESMKVSKKTERLLAERVLIEKEYEGLGGEISTMENAVEKYRKDIGKMRTRISEETSAIATLGDTCGKLRKEAEKKLKERDAFKSDTAIISKQIEEINTAKRRASAAKPMR